MKKIIVYITPLFLLVSCVKSLDDFNIDRKNPGTVTAESLFANATKTMTDVLTTPFVEVNVFRFWMQHWTPTTYLGEARYNLVTYDIPLNFWTPLYQEVLMDLQTSRKIVEGNAFLDADVKANQIALTEIVSVYAWTVVVNTWGDVPYFEALNIEEFGRPKYDDAAGIYDDLLKRLNAAIAQISPDASGFGASDLLYGDAMEKWMKFANSLKLKMAITLADVEPDKARAVFNASKAKAFASNADNAAFVYQAASPHNNPVSEHLVPPFTSRQDYVLASTLVGKMQSLQDPRIDVYGKDKIDGQYKGGTPGATSPFADFSHVGDKITNPAFEALLLDYAEVEFMKAEAAARGWGGVAATHYNNAIRASMAYWGVPTAQATAYLSQPAVAYATAAGDFKQKIGIQKWLALYNRGYDAWVEWRRMDYPKLSPAQNADGPLPTRLPYVTSEYTLNRANVSAAAAKIPGGDEAGSKVFWDKF